MALISNVTAGATIDPTWGNAIRDQGVQTTTSGARPGTPAEGMLIYETDTDRLLVYSGTAWVRVGQGTTSGRTGCTIRKTGNTSVGNVANATITWTAEDVDTDGFIAVSSSTVTIPANLGGLYSVACSVTFDTGGVATTIGVSILANVSGTNYGYSGSVLAANNTPTQSGNVKTSGMSIALPLSAGDTLTFSTIQSSGGSLNLTSAIAHVYRIGV